LNSKGVIEGKYLYDIDFDGRFDCKAKIDKDGNIVSRSISLNKDWQAIDFLNISNSLASTSETAYIFDPNIGEWREKEYN
jgi:hypothetical protein